MSRTISYALTLESRQFLREMAMARKGAVDAARGIGGAFGASMGTVKADAQGAQQAVQGFSSAQAALARAMGGDLVGAAGAATAAIKGMTSAMMTNPWTALALAVAAVTVAIVKAAQASAEYRQRVREAREENEAFTRSLEELAEKWQAGRKQSAFEKRLKEANDAPAIERAIRRQEGKVETARKEAVEAAQELQEYQSLRRPNEKRVEELKARRDEAKSEYEAQLTVLGRYKDMLVEWGDKQKKAAEDYRKTADERAKQTEKASRAEVHRREYEAAKDDPAKLTELAAKRRAEVAGDYGDFYRDDYEERLQRGEATAEEITERKEIEQMLERAVELTKKKGEEAAKAAREEKRNQEELFRAREEAFVREGDHKRLQAMSERITEKADEKFGKFTPNRIVTATKEELEMRDTAARLAKEAKQLQDAAQKDKEKARGKPWVEGVVAARGMSIGDVFSSMRSMNGAKMRDPNVDYNRQTAEKTASIERSVNSIARALGQEGVH